MQQMDLFDSDPQFYLYSEVRRVENSMDKRCQALFALYNEVLEQLKSIKEKDRIDSN